MIKSSGKSSSGITPSQLVPVVVSNEASAEELPARVMFFLPNSAEATGSAQGWSLVMVQGGQVATLEIEQSFEIYATCEIFAPDRPSQAVGRFSSKSVRVTKSNTDIKIGPVLGAHGDLIGLQVDQTKDRPEKLTVHAAATLDRAVTVHVLQNGRDLFEARHLAPGGREEFDTSAGFFLGLHVALLEGLYDLNSPGPTGLMNVAFMKAQELGTASAIRIQGALDEGFTMRLGGNAEPT